MNLLRACAEGAEPIFEFGRAAPTKSRPAELFTVYLNYGKSKSDAIIPFGLPTK